MKEIKDDAGGDIYHVLGLEESTLSKLYPKVISKLYPKVSKVIYRFNEMSIKLSIALFSQNQNKISYNLRGNMKDPKEPGKPEKEKQTWRNQTP